MNRDERIIESLIAIERLRSGHKQVLKTEKWLLYLFLTSEEHINLERVKPVKNHDPIYLVKYVEKSLKVLRRLKHQLDDDELFIVENVLRWSEVAKGGLKHHRTEWLANGYNLYVHNIGSAQIFDATEKNLLHKEVIYKLILTHGLVGQYIRGEVTLGMQSAVYELIQTEEISEESLNTILTVLNQCIIEAVNVTIWEAVEDEVKLVINQLVTGFYRSEYDIKTRIQKLRHISIQNGEDYKKAYQQHVLDQDLEYELRLLLASADLWFVEAALHDFSFEEFIKIMMLIYETIDLDEIHHISFEAFMKDMYYNDQGKKKINIYKKRIIKKYLSQMTIDEIIDGKFKETIHVKHEVLYFKEAKETAFLTFNFSDVVEKLIAFCEAVEASKVLYNKTVLLFNDLFEHTFEDLEESEIYK